MRTSSVREPGAHLRVVSDQSAGTSGIAISGVSKTYRSRDGEVPSLRPLDFRINEGEFFVVVGPSGCGKSTLLKMISGLLAPSTGEILVDGNKVTEPHGDVGIVFQDHLLLDFRTAFPLDEGDIKLALQVEPELRPVAEIAPKPHRGVCGDRPPLVKYVRDAAGGNAEIEREPVCAQLAGFQLAP